MTLNKKFDEQNSPNISTIDNSDSANQFHFRCGVSCRHRAGVDISKGRKCCDLVNES